MIYRVVHKTVYAYEEPAQTSQNQVHLTPRDLPYQHCLSSHLTVDPAPRTLLRHTDYFGNIATTFGIDEPHEQVNIAVTSKVEVQTRPEMKLSATPAWEQTRDQVAADRSPEGLDAYQFVFPSFHIRRGAVFRDYARPSFPDHRPVLEAVMDLTRRIHTDFKYNPGTTSIATSIEEVLEHRQGVCQDFAHFQLACLRSLGLPARYVSGYLRTDPPPGQPRLVGADASHAWIEAFSPSQGWVGFDPTNHCVVNDRHIVVAVGHDFGDVSPIKGVVLGGGAHRMTVHVDVTPVQAAGRSG